MKKMLGVGVPAIVRDREFTRVFTPFWTYTVRDGHTVAEATPLYEALAAFAVFVRTYLTRSRRNP